MTTIREWFVLIFLSAVMLAVCFGARAKADVCSISMRTATCERVRACVMVAGGLKNAKEKALKLGFSKAEIASVVWWCSLR